ncbi:amino-acid acetyltransferase, mitochondrial [Coccidioides immitis RS]|uniref:Amino-acid acetyltransferase, mitochondrial n=2 Tax=Coccidioides immitis TaxID=5501 RepID=NAGS_COCIM|nr:amino-acid acetyltransferase, mitochondrial [Coccidioides immitis RS]Q1DNE1.1 RecName: Full=Amino-acid acetyltransferase, mitochondrial; AltName: Full=Arginine-requiring protein 2; AltName: Full=Glutamate N-acetyltransferase; AltName: Full=N-acetylglutamate synthase; Short=AGS; Short=NAGS; Flags: Precursor [Coccidioides immitis RS]EAS29426.3 amino-acid acetyltransferase, mitochondrial [Coccidioides immitis RS]KMP06570.1 amino-acid N-acetyltransferase [Coccidioides immitis RMSCC 2394]TPX22489
MSRSTVLGWCTQSCRLLQKHDHSFSFPTFNGSPPLKKRRFCDSAAPAAPRPSIHRPSEYIPHSKSGGEAPQDLGHKAREKEAEKEFYLSLLCSASTKREAKSYLSRFKAQKTTANDGCQHITPRRGDLISDLELMKDKPGVNLGSMFSETRTVAETPAPKQEWSSAQSTELFREKIHVALVKLRKPQLLDDQTLHGVAKTLVQLSRLGMSCCIVIDVGTDKDETHRRIIAREQADRLSAVIDANHGPDSRQLDSIITVPSATDMKLSVLSRGPLLSPLQQGHVVVVVPVGYANDTQRAVLLPANEVVFALSKELAGLELRSGPDEDATTTANKVNDMQKQVSLDRIIILDPAGGIPSLQRRPHVFINLEQEFEDIARELSLGSQTGFLSINDSGTASHKMPVSSLGKSNPISIFVEEELVSLPKTLGESQEMPRNGKRFAEHLENLNLLQRTLSYLPPSSSGIIVTPHEVALSAKGPLNTSAVSAVRTRRQRNPLIHNLLTDKPFQSASLPLGRLGVKSDCMSAGQSPATHSTFVKRGMPLTMLPDPRVEVWAAKKRGEPALTLDDPRIDLPRLIHLIEDSFGRKLDARHYVDRINPRLAGLIIAGEYEGGAVLTWETPPGLSDDGSEEFRARMVPYLDKFAVLKRSQGAGGVADIVFNAMVRTCFPQGVCWRSRANNPVNKWYFERSRGTWKLPGTNWTMFWTTAGVPENQSRFWDYEGVCRAIEPSWADKTQQAD